MIGPRVDGPLLCSSLWASAAQETSACRHVTTARPHGLVLLLYAWSLSAIVLMLCNFLWSSELLRDLSAPLPWLDPLVAGWQLLSWAPGVRRCGSPGLGLVPSLSWSTCPRKGRVC